MKIKKFSDSILSTVAATLWLIILFILLAWFVILTSESLQSSLQKRFVTRVSTSDQIVSDLEVMETAFQNFRRTPSQEQRTVYQTVCAELEQDLSAYESMCSDAQITKDYIRRIRNYNEYQLGLLDEKIGSVAFYNNAYYIATATHEHLQQAKVMSQEDLDISSKQYDLASRQIRLVTMLISGIFLVCAFVISRKLYLIYVSIKKNMVQISSYFEQLRRGEWNSEDLVIRDTKEFQMLSGMVNQLKNQIRDNLEEIQKKAEIEKQLKEEQIVIEKQHSMLVAAQLSELRAQLSPHFLFNALNMIGMTAMIESGETVMQLVEATGKILRYSLYDTDLIAPLDTEVDIVEQYLFLQKRRFGDSLTVLLRNELEGEEYRIPSMMIQPLVENCFKHGFGNRKTLEIHIMITLEEKHIRVSVRDNGVGVDIHSKSYKEGIGLSNIRRRLELRYGENRNLFRLDSVTGEYTEVVVMIPVGEQEDEYHDSRR